MRLGILALMVALLGGSATLATGQTPYYGMDAAQGIAQVGHCDCGEAVCGCEAVGCCDTGCEPECGCESSCCDMGCDSGCDSCCDSCGCGNSFGMPGILDLDSCCCSSLCGDCCLGDPCSLFGECGSFSAGGWVQTGYHTKANGIFNDRPDELNLHQAWFWAEKSVDGSCGFDIGGRIDYVYGIDGPNTQAFGTDPRGWDNDWDNGPDNSGYGMALPQLYGEVAYGDLSVKAGHFYTIIGYEVVTAPDNFFYSHAYTFNFSEPFTHTGALATYSCSDDLTVYGGYVLGWDSGFDDNGDAYLGGVSAQLTSDWNFTYATVVGRFGERRFGGATAERGYMHSMVSQYDLCEGLQWIAQSDYLDTDDQNGAEFRNTYGQNHYLIKTINDCLGVGTRFEWWATRNNTGGRSHIYALTAGMNYRPHANIVVRPEVRWDWDDDQDVANLENGDDSQTTFGIDSILTF